MTTVRFALPVSFIVYTREEFLSIANMTPVMLLTTVKASLTSVLGTSEKLLISIMATAMHAPPVPLTLASSEAEESSNKSMNIGKKFNLFLSMSIGTWSSSLVHLLNSVTSHENS
jgi:hypothetical protein